jgi:hypothetical protein
VTDDCSCAPGADDAGNRIYQRDHDNDPATPERCVGFELDADADDYWGEPEGYTWYAYDVIYAYAHAAQHMLDAGATEFDKAGMIDALKEVTFNSVTGLVDFESSGDREVRARERASEREQERSPGRIKLSLTLLITGRSWIHRQEHENCGQLRGHCQLGPKYRCVGH